MPCQPLNINSILQAIIQRAEDKIRNSLQYLGESDSSKITSSLGREPWIPTIPIKRMPEWGASSFSPAKVSPKGAPRSAGQPEYFTPKVWKSSTIDSDVFSKVFSQERSRVR